MNKELKILYLIFELELSPPFEVKEDLNSRFVPDINNKYSESIGWFSVMDKNICLEGEKEDSILRKVKQVFNVDKFSDDDIYHIVKHLFNWLQDKFPEDFESIEFWNGNIGNYIDYP